MAQKKEIPFSCGGEEGLPPSYPQPFFSASSLLVPTQPQMAFPENYWAFPFTFLAMAWPVNCKVAVGANTQVAGRGGRGGGGPQTYRGYEFLKRKSGNGKSSVAHGSRSHPLPILNRGSS